MGQRSPSIAACLSWLTDTLNRLTTRDGGRTLNEKWLRDKIEAPDRYTTSAGGMDLPDDKLTSAMTYLMRSLTNLGHSFSLLLLVAGQAGRGGAPAHWVNVPPRSLPAFQ